MDRCKAWPARCQGGWLAVSGIKGTKEDDVDGTLIAMNIEFGYVHYACGLRVADYMQL